LGSRRRRRARCGAVGRRETRCMRSGGPSAKNIRPFVVWIGSKSPPEPPISDAKRTCEFVPAFAWRFCFELLLQTNAWINCQSVYGATESIKAGRCHVLRTVRNTLKAPRSATRRLRAISDSPAMYPNRIPLQKRGLPEGSYLVSIRVRFSR
jgi:hypothetical protein